MNRRDWTSIGLLDRKWHPRLVQRYSRPFGANPLRFLRAHLGVWLYGRGLGHGKRSPLSMPYLHMRVGPSTVSKTGLSVIGQPKHAAGNRSLTLGKMAWKESAMGMRKSQPATQPRTFSDAELPVFPKSPRDVSQTETTASGITDTSIQRTPSLLQDQDKASIYAGSQRSPALRRISRKRSATWTGIPQATAQPETPIDSRLPMFPTSPLDVSQTEAPAPEVTGISLRQKPDSFQDQDKSSVGRARGGLIPTATPPLNQVQDAIEQSISTVSLKKAAEEQAGQPLTSRLQERRGLSNIESGRRTLPRGMPLLRRVISSANPDRMLTAVRFQSVPTIKRIAKAKSIRLQRDRAVGTRSWSLPDANRLQESVFGWQEAVQPLSGMPPVMRSVSAMQTPHVHRAGSKRMIQEGLSSFPGAVAGEVESRPSGREGFIPWLQERRGLSNIESGRRTLPRGMPLLRRVISSANPDRMLTAVRFQGEGESGVATTPRTGPSAQESLYGVGLMVRPQSFFPLQFGTRRSLQGQDSASMRPARDEAELSPGSGWKAERGAMPPVNQVEDVAGGIRSVRRGLSNIESGRRTLPRGMPLLRRVISSANPDRMLTAVRFQGEGETSVVAPLLDQVHHTTEQMVSGKSTNKTAKAENARIGRAVPHEPTMSEPVFMGNHSRFDSRQHIEGPIAAHKRTPGVERMATIFRHHLSGPAARVIQRKTGLQHDMILSKRTGKRIIDRPDSDRSGELARNSKELNKPGDIAWGGNGIVRTRAPMSFAQTAADDLTRMAKPDMVWCKTKTEPAASILLSVGENGGAKMSPPINSAIGSVVPTAHQTMAANSSNVEAGSRCCEVSTPTAERAARAPAQTGDMDLQQVAEQVSRLIFRKLAVERERRGIGR